MIIKNIIENDNEPVLIEDMINENVNSADKGKKADDKVRPVASSKEALDEYHAIYEKEQIVEYHANIDDEQAAQLLEQKQKEIEQLMKAEFGEEQEVAPPVEEKKEESSFFGKITGFFKGK